MLPEGFPFHQFNTTAIVGLERNRDVLCPNSRDRATGSPPYQECSCTEDPCHHFEPKYRSSKDIKQLSMIKLF